MEDKYTLIENAVLKSKEKDPLKIVKEVMHADFINIHGPEHHFLDGAAFLVAYYNASKTIDLNKCLAKLKERAIKMPGAMCGYWGVCGSVTSIGSSLAIIHETGPLTDNDFYKDNMEYTSSVIGEMSKIGGPRCCKRNAFLSLTKAIDFVEQKYGVKMDKSKIKCEFSSFNKQCIKSRCPFYNKEG